MAVILYVPVTPLIVNSSCICGLDVNPSVINVSPDCEAPLTRGVPRWESVEVEEQSRLIESSSPNFSSV